MAETELRWDMSNKCKWCGTEVESVKIPIRTEIEGIVSDCCSRIDFICPKCGRKKEKNIYDDNAKELLLKALGLEDEVEK